MLAAARERGCIHDYTGWRRSLKGQRFQLLNVVLWNVISPGSPDILGQVPASPPPLPPIQPCAHLTLRCPDCLLSPVRFSAVERSSGSARAWLYSGA